MFHDGTARKPAENNNELIAALMVQIIWRTRTVYSNVHQKTWGDNDSCSEWFQMQPMKLGAIEVTVERVEDDAWATFSFGGVSVQTELGGKRNYYHGVHQPVMSDLQWVEWFNSAIAELKRLDGETLTRLGFRR